MNRVFPLSWKEIPPSARRDAVNALLLLLAVVLAYWQISFLQNSVKWDMINNVLPWKYFAGECLQHHLFPLWNPYQQLGYPIHADLQYPIWNPEVWIIGLAFGYTNYTLHFLFVCYLWIAGWGLYCLLKTLGAAQRAALLMAIAYSLSGFFVSHVQSLALVVGGAWIPHAINGYLVFYKAPSLKNAIRSTLFLLLAALCAYQALTIIMGYFLLALFCTKLVAYWREKNRLQIWSWLWKNTFMGVLLLLGCSVLIAVVFQVSPHLSRFGGLSLETAMANPFPPKALLSWLFPFASVKETSTFFKTDVSMNNGYIGLLSLLFFFRALFGKKDLIQKAFLFFGLFCLAASFGDYLPIRKWLFLYVPGMNLFRFPSIFVLFSTLSFLVLAGLSLSKWLNEKQKDKILQWLVLLFAGFTTVAIVFSSLNVEWSNLVFFDRGIPLFQRIKATSIYEHLLLQGVFQLAVLLVFFFAIRMRPKTNLLFALIFLEMGTAVQLNIYYTGVSDVSPQAINRELKQQPKGFPPPGKTPVALHSDASVAAETLTMNANIFAKRISYDGASSFWLKGYDSLYNNMPQLKEAVLSNGPVYLSSEVRSFSNFPAKINAWKDRKVLYFSDKDFLELKAKTFGEHPNDEVKVIQHTPSSVEVSVKTAHPQMLTLLQSHYPGWQVKLNGQPSKLYKSNGLFLSTLVPPGAHTIVFLYENKAVVRAAMVSALVLVLLLCLVFLWAWKEKTHQRPLLLAAFLFLGVWVVLAVSAPERVKKKTNLPAQSMQLTKETWEKELNLNNLPTLPGELFEEDLQAQAGLWELMEFCSRTSEPYLVYNWSSDHLQKEAEAILSCFYGDKIKEQQSEYWGSSLFKRRNGPAKQPLLSSANTVLVQKAYWSYKPQQRDTAIVHSSPFSIMLDEKTPFGEGFEIKTASLPAKPVLVSASAWVNLQTNADAQLVVNTVAGEISEFWQSSRINFRTFPPNNWQRVSLTKVLEVSGDPSERLKVYIWNNSGLEMRVDDLSVAIYALE